MKKWFLLVAIVMVLSVSLVFAGARTDRGGTFTVALSEDIQSLDPGTAWNFVDNQVTNQIAEGLVSFDAHSNIVPALAKSWRQVDDLTYVYDVRDDIVFSDGSRMTMDDVLFSFERARDPEGGTWFADFYADVASFSVSGWQFTIKLGKPNAIFKFVPATGAGRIISKAHYEKVGKDKFGAPDGGVIGTGPFVYKSWSSGQEVVLTKNTNYWNAAVRDANIIDTLVFKVIPDDTTRVIALQNGSVDFSVNIPVTSLGTLESDKRVKLTVVGAYTMQTLGFNTQRAPMSDRSVRQAVSHALDLQNFQRNILKSAGFAGTILPFGPALYGENAARWQAYLNTASKYDFNLARARELLAQSAYPNGFNATLIVSDNSLANSRALFVQESLKQININVEIIRLSGEEHDNYQAGGVVDANGRRDYDMLLGGWEADYPDIYSNVGTLLVSSQAEDGYNSAAYVNPQVDALIEQQLRVNDAAARFEVQKQLMDIVVGDTPYIPFDYTTRQSVLNNKYTGLEISPAWLWVLPVQNIRRAQ
ncbi:MAG: ABC transporter substrate-binding protein [Spirochaetaceae bacterium]|jgi:peptide/nickel transport system substrate-binding protein|nr:ABC transporter substrate-binding protein [Spirochaetaceae bacterium]